MIIQNKSEVLQDQSNSSWNKISLKNVVLKLHLKFLKIIVIYFLYVRSKESIVEKIRSHKKITF